MATLSTTAIATLWYDDQENFRRAYRRFTAEIASTSWSFAFCDDLADFCKRVLDATGDHTLLAATTAALPELGASHNRWHVRGVLTVILQAIRDGNIANAALEGLREAPVEALKWSLPEFNARSLHPRPATGHRGNHRRRG
jgi:hypothetical protein